MNWCHRCLTPLTAATVERARRSAQVGFSRVPWWCSDPDFLRPVSVTPTHLRSHPSPEGSLVLTKAHLTDTLHVGPVTVSDPAKALWEGQLRKAPGRFNHTLARTGGCVAVAGSCGTVTSCVSDGREASWGLYGATTSRTLLRRLVHRRSSISTTTCHEPEGRNH